MATLTVRNLSDEMHRALRVRAALHGQSMAAEMRQILESALMPAERVKLGSLLVEMGRQLPLTDAEFAAFSSLRDRTPAPIQDFEL